MAKMRHRRKPSVHVNALEGIVSANTFFTVAVLIGITGTITPSSSISPNCVAGDDIVRNLFFFEIVSFGFYLLSSLLAQGMKLAVTLLVVDDFTDDNEERKSELYYDDEERKSASLYFRPSYDLKEMKPWRVEGLRQRRSDVLQFAARMMMVAGLCTILGTIFLLLSIVDAIQLKFGLLCCGIPIAVGTTLVLTVLVGGGLLFYLCTLIYALRNYLLLL